MAAFSLREVHVGFTMDFGFPLAIIIPSILDKHLNVVIIREWCQRCI
jgi:hypothetical protein